MSMPGTRRPVPCRSAPRPAQDAAWTRRSPPAGNSASATNSAAMSPDEVPDEGRRTVFRGGVFMPSAATVQPALLARGLRRVLLERGVSIHEGDPCRRARRRTAGALGRVGPPVDGAAGSEAGVRFVRTVSAFGEGELIGHAAVRGPQRVGRGVAVVRSTAGDLVELHRPDRADPGPPGRAWLDRRRRRGRRAVHVALPAHHAGWPDRARRRRWPGRLRRPDRAGVHRRPAICASSRSRPAPALPVAARRPDRGRLGRPDRHHRRPPAHVRDPFRGARSTTGTGTPGTGSRRRLLVAGSWLRWRWSAGRPGARAATRRTGGPGFRPNPAATSARGSSERRSSGRSRRRNAASGRVRCCGSSAGCRAGWATTWDRSSPVGGEIGQIA